MRATGESKTILPHPLGTFSNVTRDRRRIKGKIFAAMFNGVLPAATGGRQKSDPVVVVRRSIGSFADATPYRRRVRSKIFAGMFIRDSCDGPGGGPTSNPVVSAS